jgi:hypothetical protein
VGTEYYFLSPFLSVLSFLSTLLALLICIDKLKTGLKLLEQIKKAIDVDEDQSHTRSKTRPKSTSSIDLDGV